MIGKVQMQLSTLNILSTSKMISSNAKLQDNNLITPRNANVQVNWLITSNMNWSNSISQLKSPNKSKTYKKQQCPIYTPFLFFQTLSTVRFDSHVTLTARKSCLSGNKHYAVGNVAALKRRHLQAIRCKC